jgi:hypothetical protein
MRNYIEEQEIKDRLRKDIQAGHYPVCIHLWGQDLANALSSIIEDQQKEIWRLKSLDRISPLP